MKTPPADHLPDDIVALKQQLLAQSQLLQSQQNQLEKALEVTLVLPYWKS